MYTLGCISILVMVHMEKSEDNFQESAPSTLWILGIKLWSSGWVAGTLAPGVMLMAQSSHHLHGFESMASKVTALSFEGELCQLLGNFG